MRNLKLLLMLVAISTIMSSCATMFGGSKYRAQVKVPNHPNASIEIDGREYKGGSVLHKRAKLMTVTVNDEGCEEFERTYDRKMRGTIALNLLSGYWFWVGGIVDFATGATYKPDDDDVDIDKISTKEYRYTIDMEDNCKQPITSN